MFEWIDELAGEAFISYVHEDSKRVDRLQAALEAAGVRVWRDTTRLWPGQDWRAQIRRAITGDRLAFIACFSDCTEQKDATYQREELTLAIEQMLLRPRAKPWLIPVKFAPCDIPDLDLGTGQSMNSVQYVDLFEDSWERGIPRLLRVVLEVLQDRSAGLSELMAQSVLGAAPLIDLLDAAGAPGASVSPLLQRLARRQAESVTWFLRQLQAGGEIGYDGEDREWLLGLTEESQRSIDAISLSTVDAGLYGFDGGLWTSDLGARYLDRQREAIARGVEIRRIFVFADEALPLDETFLKVAQMQRDVGVDVRTLNYQLIPELMRPMIRDFIVFDGAVSYELTTATIFNGAGYRPAIVWTSLSPMPSRTRAREMQFDQLWLAADRGRQLGA